MLYEGAVAAFGHIAVEASALEDDGGRVRVETATDRAAAHPPGSWRKAGAAANCFAAKCALAKRGLPAAQVHGPASRRAARAPIAEVECAGPAPSKPVDLALREI